jgi:hypothetical protein
VGPNETVAVGPVQPVVPTPGVPPRMDRSSGSMTAAFTYAEAR